jgi:hypothetical protein
LGRVVIAALYVESGGAYFGLPDVDPWDEQRDARLYGGPHPVVAHPPCNKWSPLAYINQKRLPGYRVGDDGGCFEAALRAVNAFGGVLEHPANSIAWRTFGLTKPERGRWLGYFGSYVTEVDQGRYGHRARKRTWLDWTPSESAAIVSGFLHHPPGAYRRAEHRRVRPREASRTPDAFRDVLLALARGAW